MIEKSESFWKMIVSFGGGRRVSFVLLTAAVGLVAAALIGVRSHLPVLPEVDAEAALYPQLERTPEINGDQRLGGTVTCSRGSWNDSPSRRYSVSFAWRRDNVAIGGASGSTYLVKAADLGHELRCAVTAESEDGSTTAVAAVYPYPRGRLNPGLRGDPVVESTLECGRGAWDERADSPYSITYQWRRDNGAIVGATGSTYKVARADLGHSIDCLAIAAGLAQAQSPSAYVTPRNLAAPSISGDPRVGGSLSCGRGTWDDPPGGPYAVTYRWFRENNEIPSQTGATYLVQLADLGHSLQCRVTAEGLVAAYSPSVSVYPDNRSVPVLSGDPRPGGSLACSRGVWNERPGSPQFDTAYRWIRDGVPLSDETEPKYDITAADLGHSLQCRVTVAGLNSAASDTVTLIPRYFLAPALSGDPRLGGTLNCSRGSWDERTDTPYSVAYTWYRSGTKLDASGSTHAVTKADLGGSLYCTVTAHSLVTASSNSVEARLAGLLRPKLSGSPYVGSTLSCSRGSWDEGTTGTYQVTYRWLRNGNPIEGATASTYVVTDDDLNMELVCEVTAEDYARQYSVGLRVIQAPAPGAEQPVNLVSPQISGDPRLGGTLTCSRGEWNDTPGSPYSVSLRWYREYPYNFPRPDPIGEGSSYTVTGADLQQQLWCLARVGEVEAYDSVYLQGPRSLAEPEITGDLRIGHLLTCTRGGWDDPGAPYAISYAWYRSYPFNNPAPEAIDEDAEHVVSVADVQAGVLYCLVEAEGLTEALASRSMAMPQATVQPEIEGDGRAGTELTCTRGSWDDEAGERYPVTYSWYRDYPFQDPAPDQIEADATHTVSSDDLGKYLYCVVTAASTGRVTATRYVEQPRSLRPPVMSGSLRIGQQASCDRGIWDDPEGAPYPVTFAWYRGYLGSNPPPPLVGTGPTHTIVAADLGQELTCAATAPGGAVASSARYVSGPVAISPPELDHEPRVGVPTTCSRGSWDDPVGSPYPVTYSWYRNWVGEENLLASGATYTPVGADVGRSLICVVRAAGLTDSTLWTSVRPPELKTQPTILGDRHLGGRLVCTRGDWDDEEGSRYPVSFAWYRDIPGSEAGAGPIGTTNHHTVAAEDLGGSLRCVVSVMGLAEASTGISPEDRQPVLEATAEDDQPAPGGTVAVSLRISNGGATPLEVDAIWDRPFAGANYVPGSSTGASTADPSNDGDLYWQLNAVLGPGESLVQSYRVALPPGTADLVDRPGAYTSRPVTVPLRARVSPQADPAASQCTVVGTAGDDVLVGTAGNDVVCGLGGDDSLDGGGGADTVWGGDGADRLEGGAAADALRGGHGNDVLIGGLAGDQLSGGGGTDLLSYADRFDGVAVTLGSGIGDDGAPGEGDTALRDVERVRGGSGDDSLSGDDDPNQLDGRGGDDVIVGSGAIDELIGGAGDDDVDSLDANQELVDCGGGEDAIARDPVDRVVGCERDH